MGTYAYTHMRAHAHAQAENGGRTCGGHGALHGVCVYVCVQVAPFDAAIVVLVLTGMVVVFTWTENYGGESQGSVPKQLTTAIITITSGRDLHDTKVHALHMATLLTSRRHRRAYAPPS